MPQSKFNRAYLVHQSIFILCLFTLGWNSSIYAQYENLKFSQFDERDGLSNNNVNCLIQDKAGFIWVGTNNGLSRFDGYQFKNYLSDPNDSLSLIHNHVLTFFLSSDSTLWIGTQDGICCYNRRTNDFQQYKKGYSDGYIRGIYEDKNGKVYSVNDRGQIYVVQENRLSLVKDLNFHSFSYLHDSEGNHWFGGNEGLYLYESEKDTVKLFRISQSEDIAVFSILEDNDRIWLGTRGNGIFYYEKTSGNLRAFEKKLDFIKTLQKDRTGNLLIGDTENLKIYNKRTGNLSEYQPLINRDEQEYTKGAVDVIMQDNQGNIWLGVKFRGINLAFIDKGFRYIDYESQDPYDITKKTIISIVADTDEDIWIGSYTNGIENVNLRNKTSKYYSCVSQINGLPCGSNYELYRDRDSILWIGNYEGGLLNFIPHSKKFFNCDRFFSGDDAIPLKDVRSICEDYEGNYWIISHGIGLIKWNPKTKQLSSFQNDPENDSSLVNNWAFHVICDNQGFIWVATPYGLSVSRDGITFTNYQANPDDSTSLPSSEIFTVFEDSNNQIWIGTREGLSKYIPETDNFINYNKDDGLIDNYICSILEDSRGGLWIATKKGLSSFNPTTGEIKNYDKGDGLQDNEFMENSCAISPGGYMIFGSVNRGTWFHPDSLKENLQPPLVYLTDFKLFNKSVPIIKEDKDALLSEHIGYTSKIVLNHQQKVISFEFVAINYIHPEKNRYAYKLENFDEDWTYLDENREITYTNLTPGQYVFKVIASNNDGYWNNEGTSLNITVLPPFWKTIWFRILIIIAFLSITFLLYHLRTRRVRGLNLKLEQIVMNRTKELRELNTMKDKFFSIIGHDLKGPINVIKGFSELMSEDFDELDNDLKKKYLGHINKTVTKTSDLLENLLNWAKSQSGKLSYNPEIVNIHLLIQNSLSLFKESAKKKKIKLIKSLDDSQIFVFADMNMIDTVIRNLISNAIKFTGEGGEITVETKNHSKDGFLIVSVIDSGVGIAEGRLKNLFRIDASFSAPGTDGETGTGLGLILCKEFVEKNGGKLEVISKLKKGASFSFTLPISDK